MDKLFLIDASGYLYRSYFAIREMTNQQGESTNALFGFIRSLLKLIKDFHPTHMAAVFDGPSNALSRTAIYADYKAHRKSMPKDLVYQIEWAQQFCQWMGIHFLSIAEVEADDTLGSVAQWAANLGTKVFLCTSDKDMCQLVTDKICILNTFKENLILNPKEVFEQFGVEPHQMIDYLAITGDASDNVPGLTGFGPKTAAELLARFGSLDSILENANEIPGRKKQEVLKQEKEKVLLSRRLVTINTLVSFKNDPNIFSLSPPDTSALRKLYLDMNFSSLLRELDSQNPEAPINSKSEKISYSIVDTKEELEKLVKTLSHHPSICIDTETTSLHPLQAEIVGIGLGYEQQQAWYVPTNGKMGLKTVIGILKPFFENPKTGFYGHNIKYDAHVLQNHGITIANISFDTLLASYLLNSHSRQHSLDHLSLELFGKVKTSIQELIGKGKNQISMCEVPIEKVSNYCCEDVDYTIRLKKHFTPQIEERGFHTLYYNLELPILSILLKMERHGIFLEKDHLNHLSIELCSDISILTEEIYLLAGQPFNLNSPKQLSSILFEKMGIHPPKKTATGLSTNADVLETLKENYPIAAKLLEYRTLEKLRSTYVDTLPFDINPITKRIHCTFNQSVAATGRLSCQDPNLQNIPVRSPIGQKIREAFRPQKSGWSYLSADYSQIELRLLAHMSEDPMLLHAFQSNEDIHSFTASQIFNIPIEEVTKEQRNQAKTVNFGIMYGQQAFGLSQELGIDPKTAAEFIHKYFQRYHKVKEFLELCKENARKSGRAVTFLGRERLIPEISSTNVHVRTAAERLAINTPLQGTQADLIKMAMLKIDQALNEKKLHAYMILQIHDELLFEVPDDELEEIRDLVHTIMTETMQLKVPLVVNIDIGKNWKEC